MSRPVVILLLLIIFGVGAGVLLTTQKPFESKTKPVVAAKPSAPAPAPAPSEFQGAADMLNTGKSQPATGGDQQIKILQDQVDYLQQQVNSLQQENSGLIDKLASIQRGGAGMPAVPGTPINPGDASSCAPPKMTTDNEQPDFVGIGIELVKTRALEQLPIPTVTVERKEVEKRIAKWLSTQFPRDYGVKQGRALASLGVIPAPVNTVGLKAAFLSYQLGGWYDADEGTLFMAPAPEGSTDKENALGLSYGYLFKHFGSTLFPANPKPPTLDARIARESLLAGDAALTRFLHSMQNPEKGGGGGVGEDPDDPSRAVPIPNFLRELELLPFSVGFDFMQSMHSIGEWEQVNASYKRPPIAGAEVMDSQTYLQETPFMLEPLSDDAHVAGKAPLWEDTLGPMAMVLMLKQYVAEPVAADTAPGWANDRLLTYATDGESRDHAVWRTVWRDSNAADAFFSALREGLLSKHKGVTPTPNLPPGTFQLVKPGHVVLLKRTAKGSGVLYVDAVDQAFAKAAQEKFAP